MNSCWPSADWFVLSITRHAKLLNDVSPGEALLGGGGGPVIPKSISGRVFTIQKSEILHKCLYTQ